MTRRHHRAPRARPSGGTAPEPQKSRHAWHEPRPSFWGRPPQRKIAGVHGWGERRSVGEGRAVMKRFSQLMQRVKRQGRWSRGVPPNVVDPPPLPPRPPTAPPAACPPNPARARVRAGRSRAPLPPSAPPPRGRRVDRAAPSGVDDAAARWPRPTHDRQLGETRRDGRQKSVKFFYPPPHNLRLRRAQSLLSPISFLLYPISPHLSIL